MKVSHLKIIYINFSPKMKLKTCLLENSDCNRLISSFRNHLFKKIKHRYCIDTVWMRRIKSVANGWMKEVLQTHIIGIDRSS
jgi:hypothetical protein